MKITAIILILFLAACAPSQNAVQTAIAETQAALPVVVEVEQTATREPTHTFTPEPTAPITKTPDPSACTMENVKAAAGEFVLVMAEWEDALEIADATPRMNLSGPVANLQEIQRDARQVPAPACMDNFKTHLDLSMEAYIDAILAFMEKREGDVQGNMDQGKTQMDIAKAALEQALEHAQGN